MGGRYRTTDILNPHEATPPPVGAPKDLPGIPNLLECALTDPSWALEATGQALVQGPIIPVDPVTWAEIQMGLPIPDLNDPSYYAGLRCDMPFAWDFICGYIKEHWGFSDGIQIPITAVSFEDASFGPLREGLEKVCKWLCIDMKVVDWVDANVEPQVYECDTGNEYYKDTDLKRHILDIHNYYSNVFTVAVGPEFIVRSSAYPACEEVAGGIAWWNSRVAYSVSKWPDDSDTVAHEIGHLMRLHHVDDGQSHGHHTWTDENGDQWNTLMDGGYSSNRKYFMFEEMLRALDYQEELMG